MAISVTSKLISFISCTEKRVILFTQLTRSTPDWFEIAIKKIIKNAIINNNLLGGRQMPCSGGHWNAPLRNKNLASKTTFRTRDSFVNFATHIYAKASKLQEI